MTHRPNLVTRREAIQKGAIATGAAILGGAASAGKAGARKGKGGNLVSAVASHGHFAHFPSGDTATWKRMKNPFDTTSGESRWKAKPARGGSIQCLVENIPFPRNAGFDVHLGPVGDIDSVTIDAETVETQSGSIALYGIALYLDVGDDGDFFEWNDGQGNTEVWAGFGDDGEAIAFGSADGEFTVDEDTSFPVVAHLDPSGPATWEELVDSAGPDTNAALYVGVIGSGDESGREEILVHSMDVMRD